MEPWQTRQLKSWTKELELAITTENVLLDRYEHCSCKAVPLRFLEQEDGMINSVERNTQI